MGQRPGFDFKSATTDPREFVSTAVDLEEIAVAAFNGQVPNLTTRRVLTAMKIVSRCNLPIVWMR